jgi:hypothetical protein
LFGSAPFKYHYLPDNSQACITAKSMYNDAHSAMYSPDTLVRSHPAGNIIQSSIMSILENTIKDVCVPTPVFQINDK